MLTRHRAICLIIASTLLWAPLACQQATAPPASESTPIILIEDMGADQRTTTDMTPTGDMRGIEDEECGEDELQIRTEQRIGEGTLAPGCYAVCEFDSDCSEPTPTCYTTFSRPICVPSSIQDPGPPCGDGVVQEGETCDGDCPETPDACPQSSEACMKPALVGNERSCDIACGFEEITRCVSADGCCPEGCTWANDRDCSRDVFAGVSCNTTEDCAADGVASPICIDSLRFPDGYCSSDCDRDADCHEGGLCGSTASGNRCFASCEDETDCRTGYACSNFGASSRICFPIAGEGERQPGEPCETAAQCGEGEVCRTESDGFRDGYCAELCASGQACTTPNSNCVNFTNPGQPVWGYCAQRCRSEADCREGYGCNVGNTGVCMPIASGAGAPGAPCESAIDCAGGREGYCLVREGGYPDGMCTKLCSSFSPCSAGSHCAAFSDTRVCLATCTSDSECRTGYTCKDNDGDGRRECYPPAR